MAKGLGSFSARSSPHSLYPNFTSLLLRSHSQIDWCTPLNWSKNPQGFLYTSFTTTDLADTMIVCWWHHHRYPTSLTYGKSWVRPCCHTQVLLKTYGILILYVWIEQYEEHANQYLPCRWVGATNWWWLVSPPLHRCLDKPYRNVSSCCYDCL